MLGRASLAFALFAASCYLSAGAQEKTEEVKLRVVKYDGLKEEVLKNRGKVVLIDFWADFCAPCKVAFPHTVDLHKKYESKGLAVISVALDSLEDEPAKVKDNVERFLKQKKATFTNLLLDEPDDFWQKKLRFTGGGPPCFYVFSREGKWTQFHEKNLDEKKMDQLIEELLAEK